MMIRWAILHGAIVRDLEQPWDADETHAILFGVVCGWREALPEVAVRLNHLVTPACYWRLPILIFALAQG
jgi:hypothetical protein